MANQQLTFGTIQKENQHLVETEPVFIMKNLWGNALYYTEQSSNISKRRNWRNSMQECNKLNGATKDLKCLSQSPFIQHILFS
jgi:hypothetical protein